MNFRAEDAIVAMIRANDDPAPVNLYTTADMTGDGQQISEPFVLVSATDSQMPSDMNIDPTAGVGNEQLSIVIVVRTHAANEDVLSLGINMSARDFHAQTAGRIKAIICSQNFISELMAQGVPGIGFEQQDYPTTNTQPVDRSYVTRIAFMLRAYPKGDE
jgi:hypothetical protein